MKTWLVILMSIAFIMGGCNQPSSNNNAKDVEPVLPADDGNEAATVEIKKTDFPVLLAKMPDNELQEQDQVMAIMTLKLQKEFSIFNAIEKERALLEELKTSGTLASTIPQDFLFRKSNADLCVYLACTLETKEADESAKAIDPRIKHFYWATIKCRMVDPLTGKVLFDFKKSHRGAASGKLTETAAKEEAVKKATVKAADLLLKRVNSQLDSLSQVTFIVNAAIEDKEEQDKFSDALADLKADKKIGYQTLASGALSKYQVTYPPNDANELKKLLEEASEESELGINIRINGRLIQVTPEGEEDEDDE